MPTRAAANHPVPAPLWWAWVVLTLVATPTRAQAPATAPSATPADTARRVGTAADTARKAPPPPPSPVQGIRNKVSAGDLLSAESVLEVHRAKNGEDRSEERRVGKGCRCAWGADVRSE